ncbi:hypothetical protein [Trichormus variabilis]|uniref:Uncharacterized protein n=1 Tax=Trichormus variabilis SAG 1403-4b TaxID=447716 RepID=A0A3S1CAR1_ANAVA|nr:hypothetical protein [Trichormus variabilis]MBD2625070.1 hypothetical protein [Trichormus variabilis FACHB-164]RUS99440.1 hypothetical protein DSM107003_00240 [Trichormus variabilis SAG 1403-4b]
MSVIRDLATSVFSYMYARSLKRQHLYKSKKDKIRKDVVDFEIGDNVGLEVYWKVLNVAEGPSLIFHALGYEILRFDTDINGQGHCHVQLIECQPKCKERLFLPETTVEEQIERAIFELEKNLYYWLQRHPDRQIRLLKIDQTRLKIATEKAREKMLEYAEKIKVGSSSTETVG